jgi:hypothetical protein
MNSLDDNQAYWVIVNEIADEHFPNKKVRGGGILRPAPIDDNEERRNILIASTRSAAVAEDEEKEAEQAIKQNIAEMIRLQFIPYTQTAPPKEQPSISNSMPAMHAETRQPTFVDQETPSAATIQVATNGEYVIVPPFSSNIKQYHPDMTGISVNQKTNEVMLTNNAWKNAYRIGTLNVKDTKWNHTMIKENLIKAGLMPSAAEEVAHIVDALVNQKINTGSYAIPTPITQ